MVSVKCADWEDLSPWNQCQQFSQESCRRCCHWCRWDSHPYPWHWPRARPRSFARCRPAGSQRRRGSPRECRARWCCPRTSPKPALPWALRLRMSKGIRILTIHGCSWTHSWRSGHLKSKGNDRHIVTYSQISPVDSSFHRAWTP